MVNSHSLLRSYFKQLTGLPCWHVTAEYGSWLSLRFGEPRLQILEADPASTLKSRHRRSVYVKGAFLLWIEMGHWDMFDSGKREFHSEQSRSRLRRAAARLDGQQLTAVRISRQKVTEFTFDFGTVLVLRPYEGAEPDDPLWHLYTKQRCLSFLAEGVFSYGLLRIPVPRRSSLNGAVCYTSRASTP